MSWHWWIWRPTTPLHTYWQYLLSLLPWRWRQLVSHHNEHRFLWIWRHQRWDPAAATVERPQSQNRYQCESGNPRATWPSPGATKYISKWKIASAQYWDSSDLIGTQWSTVYSCQEWSENPRYVIVAFQTGKSNDQIQNAAMFEHCRLRNIYVTFTLSRRRF